MGEFASARICDCHVIQVRMQTSQHTNVANYTGGSSHEFEAHTALNTGIERLSMKKRLRAAGMTHSATSVTDVGCAMDFIATSLGVSTTKRDE